MAKFNLFGSSQKKIGNRVKELQEQKFSDASDQEIRDAVGQSVQFFENGSHKSPLKDPATFFAGVKEAAKRTVGLDPYIPQIEGASALLNGSIAQMPTGEGKTLSGALAALGYALSGKTVSVLTVNSYLADRDVTWMKPLFDFFDVTSGAITESLTPSQRRKVYESHIVYGPVTEIGFDTLRNGLVHTSQEVLPVQTDVAIVDEVDSVLVDEALVPLVLAGAQANSTPSQLVNDTVKGFEQGKHFEVSHDHRSVFLLDEGARVLEEVLELDSLYGGVDSAALLVQANLALHAHHLVHRDVHYIVKDGALQLVDNAKGRVAQLQRWPDGLQAAVEVKEGIDVSEGGRILDSLTIQSLMNTFPRISGMTGTAMSAKDQLQRFYGVGIENISPNIPIVRFDEQDRIFITEEDRNAEAVRYIASLHEKDQPVLVGTQSIEDSEDIAQLLNNAGIETVVLNAKNPAEEARVISRAGMPGAVTVSTQMAGRGTDIKLGGSDERERDKALDAGGLAIVGIGRYRSERLDDQLRGRAGRQGDPGHAVFFVSLEDDMVLAGGEGAVTAVPDAIGEVNDAKVRHFVDHSQKVTEGQLAAAHENTWKYNKMIADQRAIIVGRRIQLLSGDTAWEELSAAHPEKARELLEKFSDNPEMLRQGAREIMLYHLDNEWSEHLAYLDDIRESIHLRAIARENPIDEFHKLSIEEFRDLVKRAVAKAEDTFDQITFTHDGPDMESEGLLAPSATWTYMISDNPLQGAKRSWRSSMSSLWK